MSRRSSTVLLFLGSNFQIGVHVAAIFSVHMLVLADVQASVVLDCDAAICR